MSAYKFLRDLCDPKISRQKKMEIIDKLTHIYLVKALTYVTSYTPVQNTEWIVKLLLIYGIDPNEPDMDCSTALHCAISNNCTQKTVRMFLQYGAGAWLNDLVPKRSTNYMELAVFLQRYSTRNTLKILLESDVAVFPKHFTIYVRKRYCVRDVEYFHVLTMMIEAVF